MKWKELQRHWPAEQDGKSYLTTAEFYRLQKATAERADAPGNPVIVLMERDGRDHYFHGAVMSPAPCADPDAEAKRIWRSAMQDDEWNYDDVLNAFRAAGWTVLNAGRMYEENV